MAPNSLSTVAENVEHQVQEKRRHETQVVWLNVGLFVYLHLSALYGLYLGFTSAWLKTAVFTYLYGVAGGLGITAGCHRLWCHRSYKARFPLRVLLGILSSVAAQNDIYEWCRDHRVHHKFTETDADPHDIKKGFFFAHMGWLMCKKHPDVMIKGKTVNLDDLWADPVVRFHRRYYIPLVLFFCFYLPTMIPYRMWNESLWNSFFICAMTRYCLSLHFTWLVNSAAHRFGNQPYDRYIEARENAIVSLLGNGEGWHNYHHVFPWDYATSELGYTLNITKVFIDFMGLLGLAYDMKIADSELVKHRMEKTGDQSRKRISVDLPEIQKLSKGI